MQHAYQQCINPDCNATFGTDEVHVSCPTCSAKGVSSLLDIRYDWSKLPVPKSLAHFESRWATKGRGDTGKLDFSGIWRFRDLLPFYNNESDIVTVGEGRTLLQSADLLAKQIGVDAGNLFLQYEGLNPSGSFKDNGMTAAFTHAKMVGASRVACASTGNTSASLALFAAHAEMVGIVFIGSGKIAYGKLSQALDYGARTLQIQGDFDACLHRVKQIATENKELGIYLMNSVNPFRLEGQKSIMFRVLESLAWEVPDWIIVPGGNLGGGDRGPVVGHRGRHNDRIGCRPALTDRVRHLFGRAHIDPIHPPRCGQLRGSRDQVDARATLQQLSHHLQLAVGCGGAQQGCGYGLTVSTYSRAVRVDQPPLAQPLDHLLQLAPLRRPVDLFGK